MVLLTITRLCREAEEVVTISSLKEVAAELGSQEGHIGDDPVSQKFFRADGEINGGREGIQEKAGLEPGFKEAVGFEEAGDGEKRPSRRESCTNRGAEVGLSTRGPSVLLVPSSCCSEAVRS